MHRPHCIVTALAAVWSLIATAGAMADGVPANDDCAAATVIAAVPFSADVDTTPATLAGTDPTLCDGAGQGGHSVWYSFTPAQNGLMRIETFSSNYDTVVGVFEGTCASPVLDACNDDFAGARTSEAFFQAHAATPMLIEVAGFVGTTRPPDNGQLHLSLDRQEYG